MKKRIIILILTLLLPISTKADSISINCNTEVVKTNYITCNIVGNSNQLITGISAKVRPGSNTAFTSFENAKGWEGNGENGKIDLYTANDFKDTFNIGTLRLGVNSIKEGGTGSVTIDSIFFYDEEGKEIAINPITKTFRIASTINNLSSLTINAGTLNPSFKSDITSYSTTIDASSITISAKAEHSKATVSGDIGTKTLNYGNNKFNIIVTSESGSKKTYTITIIRPNNNQPTTNTTKTEVKSNNTNLKTLELDQGNIEFNKDTIEYQTKVNNNVENIEVKAEPEDKKSKVEIEGNKNLKVGLNTITIKVTSEDNSTKTYTVLVERKQEAQILSNNANITNIEIDNYTINFNKDTLEYTLTINKEDSLNIKITKEDNTSNYIIEGNNNLKNNSTIKIISTAEDGTEKIYKINILKKDYDKTIKIIFAAIINILLLINIIRISINIGSKLYEK